MSDEPAPEPDARFTNEVATLVPAARLERPDAEAEKDPWSDDTAIAAPRTAELPAADPSQRYVLERELGRGGMGTVCLYLDRRIGRRIAVKTLHPEIAESGHAKARFLREACVQGQLEHPAIVPVYDIGEGEGAALRFTMKHVRGVTLDEIVRRRRAGEPIDEARHGTRRLLDAFASACLAVDFAHRRGVLHRDLKPANVMLGDFGEVYVLDWGLARLTDGDVSIGAERVVANGTASAPTHAGAVLGTPGYMAPEQARGDHDAVSPASDVYSLGAILFELLAGEPLHLGNAVPGLLASTLNGADARASIRVPSAHVPGIILASMVLSNVALVSSVAFYGPFIITPPALVANTAAYAVHLEGRERALAIGMGALAGEALDTGESSVEFSTGFQSASSRSSISAQSASRSIVRPTQPGIATLPPEAETRIA